MQALTFRSLTILTLLTAAVIALFVAAPVEAQSARDEVCRVALNSETAEFVEGQGCVDNTNPGNNVTGLFDGPFKAIANTLIFITGAISVIMIILGGIRYSVSGGDATGVAAARNTIIYAIVGLIVAMLSFAIVNLVLNRI